MNQAQEIRSSRHGRTRIEVVDRITVGLISNDGGIRHEGSWERIQFIKLTKQGVRDLNGPRMDGTGYNGHRSTTCVHHKAPDMTPKHTLIETIADEFGMPKDLRFDCCSVCGEKLGEVDR